MKNLRIGVGIITLVALVTIIGPFAADWNHTHIYNPRWTPHAKFHNAQTMLLGLGLGLSTLWFAWRRSGDAGANLGTAVLFGALYWVTQAGAITFPGTAFHDPEFPPPGQPVLITIVLILLSVAYLLESRRLKGQAALLGSVSHRKREVAL